MGTLISLREYAACILVVNSEGKRAASCTALGRRLVAAVVLAQATDQRLRLGWGPKIAAFSASLLRDRGTTLRDVYAKLRT